MSFNLDREKAVLLESQYHCRELQVADICSRAQEAATKESTEALRLYQPALSALLSTAPAYLYQAYEDYENGEIELFARAGKAIELQVKHVRIITTLNVLYSFVQRRNYSTSIALDDISLSLHRDLSFAFKKQPEILSEAELIGKNKACNALLDYLQQPEYPLLRWSENLIQSFGTPLQTTSDGIRKYSLPTIVPCVDLVCCYPRGVNMPTLSLVVKPFGI